MPRVSHSNPHLLCSPSFSYNQVSQKTNDEQQSNVLSPIEIDRILSRKLNEQLKATPQCTSISSGLSTCDDQIEPELLKLIDEFYRLTYLNTIPIVNLLATAVATNFLKENLQELDKKLEAQQWTDTMTTITAQQNSLLVHSDHHLCYNKSDGDDDDDVQSWASAPA